MIQSLEAPVGIQEPHPVASGRDIWKHLGVAKEALLEASGGIWSWKRLVGDCGRPKCAWRRLGGHVEPKWCQRSMDADFTSR